MSLELCILASGSSGNCAALRTPGGVILIDIGIGPRLTAGRMKGTGISVADVTAVCLTHLDRDHFNPNWVRMLADRGVRIFCHERRSDEVARIADDAKFGGLIEPFGAEPFEPIRGVRLHPISLAHDWEGSHGFLIEGYDCRVGYATDLGHVPESLLKHFGDVDVLAIESNYDPELQRSSGRPYFLQRRITGGKGHLSNQQAYDAVKKILDRCEARGVRLPGHIVLLHRSSQCNCPDLVRHTFSRDMRIARRLVLAEQHERTSWLGPRKPFVGQQLTLGWG